MKKSVIGILAHVDAGKTTLAEALLFRTGRIRALGRVDSGNTIMDTHSLEKERGITIFTGQSTFSTGNLEISLLDTPGHVDFSSETERTLQVLDYAILVVSGIDGVQAHTRTLWKLLKIYNIPTFIFVTKMDYARRSNNEIIEELQKELDSGCIDFGNIGSEDFNERLALCSEDALEKFLSGEKISDDDISFLIRARKAFPCFFGSGLKLEGVDEFLEGLDRFVIAKEYPDAFGAKVFKISHDKDNRLTHIKVTGGSLKVRDVLDTNKNGEKINQIRIYSGSKYETVDEVEAGGVCVVTGLSQSENGMGFGYEGSEYYPVLEPVMNYRIALPEGCDAKTFMPKLRKLEEEDPQLHISWDSFLQEIHVGLMGEVQTEILKSLIAENFDIDVEIDHGRVLYKETIRNTVEGVGHYEPLRHYAEVHLLLEPLARGRGLVFDARCSEDLLDRNWQRLVLMHLNEKEHLGVLTGSPITDMKITLVAGRAHIKHTEGGDFRQSTYRAVRQGLMQAESVLLEPYYSFKLEIPYEFLGRAINDVRMMNGSFDAPEESGDFAVIRGRAPVSTMNGYAVDVASYTAGKGRLSCELSGYDECHDAEKVIAEMGYRAEADLENTPDSVFCAHGGGFGVKWNEVKDYMHLESCLKKEKDSIPQINHRNLHIDDKELEAIMLREFGPVKYELYRPTPKQEEKPREAAASIERKKWVIVDGYNVIFAWEDLKALAETDLAGARERLMHILCNYSAFTKNNVVLVFDAYKVSGNRGERFDFHNIHVVYTKERELGDVYIEKLVSEIGKNEQVRVVSSDGLIQLSAVRFGVLRASAAEFEREIDSVHAKISDYLQSVRENNPKSSLEFKPKE